MQHSEEGSWVNLILRTPPSISRDNHSKHTLYSLAALTRRSDPIFLRCVRDLDVTWLLSLFVDGGCVKEGQPVENNLVLCMGVFEFARRFAKCEETRKKTTREGCLLYAVCCIGQLV